MELSSPKNSSTPRISVLVPVFNREAFIEQCVFSALKQTFEDIEVIIVDNASTDNTWNICNKMALLDSRVKIFRNATNIGPVKNWICCAKYARGYFSKILFSDDLLEPNCLERMYSQFQDDIGFVYSAARIGVSLENSTIHYKLKKDYSNKVNFNEYLKLLLAGLAPYSPGAALFKTKDLLKNLHLNFPTSVKHQYEKHGAGPDLMTFLFCFEGYKFAYAISEPLVYFRAHSGSYSVGDLRGEVIESYRSVISWYLINHFSMKDWARYLSSQWLIEMRNRRSYIPLGDFILNNNGKNSFFERTLFYMGIFSFLFHKGKRKLISLFSFL